jgi:triacylglycerol esterase/lipase EstA (alpha/beta hydrolase family)
MKKKAFAVAAKLSLVASAVLATTSSFAAHDPVIMIPGMTGTTSNMDTMKSNLQSNGWPSSILFEWTDSSSMEQDLAKAAQELSTEVDKVLSQTGAKKVVLATWSASTLAGRYYIKNLGGDQKVSVYVSFSGPHHGTTDNGCQFYVSCQQFGNANSSFLTALNSGTEVPGHPTVSYLTLRSNGDTNVLPTDSAMLSGADENFLMSGATAPTHFTIISDSTALAEMRKFIIAHESSTSSTTTTTAGGTTTTTATTTTTTSKVPYTQQVTDTVLNHYLAGRLTVTQYNQLGLKYGYNTSITLYLCGSTWTNSSTCGPMS